MDEKTLTPEESLEVISKSIASLKMNYRDYANIFLHWGWILTLASLSNFIIIKILFSQGDHHLSGIYSFGNWAAFGVIGFIILFFMERKSNREKKVYSHLEIYNRNLWIVAAAAFFIGSFICARMEIAPPPVMLLIAGIATTTSGLLIKFKPLIFGGISFFIFSIASTFVLNEYLSLIVCASIICGYLIPGYFLKAEKV